MTNTHQVQKEMNITRQILNMYLPYWPLFLLLLVASFIVAKIYLNYATPVYEATARIMIKDEKKGAQGSKAIEAFDVLSSKKIIENEIEVIRSRTLIDQVAKKLHLYAPVYQEQQFSKRPAYSTSPVSIQVADAATIKETKKIPFTYNAQHSAVVIGQQEYPLNVWVSTPYGKLQFTPNKYANNTANTAAEAAFFFSLVSPGDVTTSISNRLDVSASNKMSSIIDLTLRDEVPKRAEDILNELVAAYNYEMVKDKSTLAVNTLEFLDERLARVEHELDSVEKRIQRYKSGRGAIDISTEGRLFLENVSNNDQRLGEINMQLAVLDQVEGYVRSKNKNGGMVPSTLGVSDPVLTQLVNKLYTSELEYESLKKTTAENNPILVSISDQIEKIKPSILENVQNQRRSLTASRSNLNATNSNYAAMLQAIPEKERMLIDINREQTIKNELYAFLLQKREETALSHASATSDSRIVDRAEAAGTPVNPKKKLVYLSAFMAAMLVGTGFVYARETMNGKIMFRQQIENLSARPIIGEIPAEKQDELIVIRENKKTFTAEQFRRLRITLPQININSIRKRILVTSSISGEGKSFVASNLAMSLALTGKKVILLDFDLNNPSLHKLNGYKGAGITEYLQGKCRAEDIILETSLHKNLFMMMPGTLPENPSELIMEGKTAELLDQLDAIFDYIVIDTAPVVPVTDAYLLSKYCDGTLYVIRHGYTPVTLVERMDENNKIHPLTNTAIIFNGVTSRGFGNRNYGYGYGYGYIYRDTRDRKRLPVA